MTNLSPDGLLGAEQSAYQTKLGQRPRSYGRGRGSSTLSKNKQRSFPQCKKSETLAMKGMTSDRKTECEDVSTAVRTSNSRAKRSLKYTLNNANYSSFPVEKSNLNTAVSINSLDIPSDAKIPFENASIQQDKYIVAKHFNIDECRRMSEELRLEWMYDPYLLRGRTAKSGVFHCNQISKEQHPYTRFGVD